MTTTDPLMLQIKSLPEPLGTLARAKLDAITAEVEKMRAERDAARAEVALLAEELLDLRGSFSVPKEYRLMAAKAIDAALKDGEK